MAAREVTRTLTIRNRTEGAQEVARDLNEVKRAADGVVQASERTERQTLSNARSFDRLQQRVDPAYRSYRQFESAVETLSRALEQSNTSLSDANRLAALASQRYGVAAGEVQDLASAQMALSRGYGTASESLRAANDNMRLSRGQLQGLAFQINDIGTMLALGASPFAILASQGGQVAQVLGDHPGGVRGSIRALGPEIARLAGRFAPMAAGVAAVALAFRAIQTEINETSDVTVSLGDTFSATMSVLGSAIASQFLPQIEAVTSAVGALWEEIEGFAMSELNNIIQELAVMAAQLQMVLEIISGDWEGAWDRAMQRIEEIRSTDFGEKIKKQAEEAASVRLDEVFADQTKAIEGTVEALRLQVDMFGQSEGAIAAAEFRVRALAEANRLAAEAGQDNPPAEQIEKITRTAAEIATLTDRLNEMREAQRQAERVSDFLADLDLDIRTIGLPEIEAEIIRALDRLGVEADSAYGQAIAGKIRYRDATERANEELEKSRDLAKDFTETLLDGLYSGEDALESLTSAFAQLGRQFAQMGLERLFNGFQGGGVGTFGVGPGFSVSAPSLSNLPAVPVTPVQRLPLPPIEVERGPLIELSGQARDSVVATSNAFLDLIGRAEGTDRGRGYNETLAYGRFTGGDRNLIGMSLDQIDALQTSMLRHTQNTFNSSALGRYQIVRTTLRGLREMNGLSGNELFTPELQDELALQLARGRGASVPGLRAEWEGLKNVPGADILAAFNAGVGGESTLRPQIMTRAVSEGVSDGTIDAHIRAGSGMGVGFDAPGGGFFANGGMQVLGAGAGAFFGGMQSGNPLMGGISGALSGFGAAGAIGSAFPALAGIAGPVGMIGGAILGIIGGIIGNAKKKREERRKAQQELQSQMGAISSFLDEISGIFAGEYLTRFRETSDELQKIRDLAMKARDMDLVREIDDATESFFSFLIRDWEAGLQGVMDSMNAGYGFQGAFVQAQEAVKGLEEELIGFVEDARFFAEAAGDYNKALDSARGGRLNALDPVISLEYNKNAGIEGEYIDFVNRHAGLFQKLQFAPYTAFSNIASDDGPRGGRAVYESLDGLRHALRDMGVEFDELGEPIKETVDAVAEAVSVLEAQRAAQRTALAQLSGAEEFTAIEETKQTLMGMAAALETTLEKLGMTAEEASQAIEAHLQIAMEGLVREYENSLQRSINEARGADFINEVADAQALYNERLIDARELGLSTDMALQELNLRLAEIAGAADLSEGQLKALAEVFPEIASSLLGVDTKDPARTIADAQEAVERAQSDLRRAYEEQLSEIERNIDALERFIDSLSEFRDGLRLSGASPLGQKDQVDEARRQFNEVAAAAMSGDQEAMEKLQGVSQAYLDEARAYYTSSEAYFSIFEQVENILDRTLDKAGTQLTEAQRQRSLLEEQVGKLIDINDAVLTVADAIAALASAQGGMSDAEKELIDFITGQKDTINNSVPSNVDRLYRDVLGRPAEQAGIDFWRSIVGSGALTDEMYRLFVDVARRNGEAIMPDYQGYAAGGMHRGGLRLVGERGPELEVTGPARIWSFDQTSRMLGSRNDDYAALLSEVRGLRRDNQALQAKVDRLTAVSAQGHMETAAAVNEGNDIAEGMASDIRRQSARAA